MPGPTGVGVPVEILEARIELVPLSIRELEG